MAKRMSLKDRNKASITADPTTEPVAPQPAPASAPTAAVVVADEDAEPSGAPQPVTSPDATKDAGSEAPGAEKAGAGVTATASDVARVGVYLTPEQFGSAKAAYLVDWQHGGEADTFTRWIGQAIEAHAARTPEQRAETAEPRGRSATRTGSTRSFNVPVAAIARMREAINADHGLNHWPSDSAWCAEAIGQAAEAARIANGGTLPTPPARLPNRLVR